jgi:hypothetical protein
MTLAENVRPKSCNESWIHVLSYQELRIIWVQRYAS